MGSTGAARHVASSSFRRTRRARWQLVTRLDRGDLLADPETARAGRAAEVHHDIAKVCSGVRNNGHPLLVTRIPSCRATTASSPCRWRRPRLGEETRSCRRCWDSTRIANDTPATSIQRNVPTACRSRPPVRTLRCRPSASSRQGLPAHRAHASAISTSAQKCGPHSQRARLTMKDIDRQVIASIVERP